VIFLGGKAMRIKRISGALLISLVFHFIVVFIIGIHLVNKEELRNLVREVRRLKEQKEG
jgi:hypothetical protein